MPMKVGPDPSERPLPCQLRSPILTETFALFSNPLPSQNLGFVDSKTATIEATVAGRDVTIHQSPSVLSSNRAEGTTGAVVWKVTPLFADWVTQQDNLPWRTGLLSADSVVLELGCGVSAIVGLALGPKVERYVLTDQAYVGKLVAKNLDENAHVFAPSGLGAKERGRGRGRGRDTGSQRKSTPRPVNSAQKVTFTPLDWEVDEVDATLTGDANLESFDVVLALDCIYNEALVTPLVQTCVAVCELRKADATRPTVCIVAQQLRSPDVLAAWLRAMMEHFQVWRVPNEELAEGLRTGQGFVVHLAVLRGWHS
jgi:predicted nicotinamide N-methyase